MKNFVFALATICLAGFIGCSQLKEENPSPVSNRVGVHPPGFSNPADTANFHGKAIAHNNWDMHECTRCHGTDYNGGTTGVSCNTCHTKSRGPENCTTCHGSVNAAPPKDLHDNVSVSVATVGLHQKHVSGATLAANLRCSACHIVPSSLYAPGHLDGVLPAEVTFDTASVARTVTNEPGTSFYYAGLPAYTPNPSYTRPAATCQNTYCHGNFKNGNPTNVVKWTDETGSGAACGTCHGDVTKPMPERAMPRTINNGGIHPTNTNCAGCHFGIIDNTGKLLDVTKHINGKVNVFGTEQNF
ncbi:MAG: CxxxxCH/CxxCH domain c-type cytochrome [Acidobacteriota bacterium]